MKRFLIGLLATLTLITSVAAESFYSKEYDNSWSVYGMYAEQHANPMCVAEYIGKDQTRVQVVKDLADGEVYIVASNPKWTLTDKPGTPRRGRIEFRGGTTSATWPQEYISGPVNLVVFRWLQAPFFIGFTKAARMTIILEGSNNQTVTFPLTGSTRAVNELSECVTKGLEVGEELFKNVPKPKKPEIAI